MPGTSASALREPAGPEGARGPLYFRSVVRPDSKLEKHKRGRTRRVRRVHLCAVTPARPRRTFKSTCARTSPPTSARKSLR